MNGANYIISLPPDLTTAMMRTITRTGAPMLSAGTCHHDQMLCFLGLPVHWEAVISQLLALVLRRTVPDGHVALIRSGA